MSLNHLYHTSEGDVYVATSLDEAKALATEEFAGADHPEDYVDEINSMKQYDDDEIITITDALVQQNVTAGELAKDAEIGLLTNFLYL